MIEELLAERVGGFGGGEISEFMSLIDQGGIISFAGGIPDAAVFPLEELREMLSNLMDGPAGAGLFQYSSTEGLLGLKEYLITFLERRGIEAEIDQLLITTGSQQALDLLSKLFINPGDRVVVENPGYAGGLGAIKSYQAELVGIEQTAEGLDTEQLRRKLEQGLRIKLLYLVPDYSNPSGRRLSLAGREALVDLASRYNFYIIEDTPYRELGYYQPPLPTLKELDRDNRVIYLGTVSKFFIPGLRIGWILADRGITRLASLAKQNTDLASNTLGQHLITAAGEQGLIERQIQAVRPYYRIRLEAMGQALKQYFPGDTYWQEPEGGFFYWVKLPGYIKSKKLLKQAITQRVAFVTGNPFFAQPSEGSRYLRLSFSNSTPAEIKEGIRILGEVIDNYQQDFSTSS